MRLCAFQEYGVTCNGVENCARWFWLLEEKKVQNSSFFEQPVGEKA